MIMSERVRVKCIWEWMCDEGISMVEGKWEERF